MVRAWHFLLKKPAYINAVSAHHEDNIDSLQSVAPPCQDHYFQSVRSILADITIHITVPETSCTLGITACTTPIVVITKKDKMQCLCSYIH